MSIWQPGPRPAWVRAMNETCDPDWVRLDADALCLQRVVRFLHRKWRDDELSAEFPN